MLKEQVAMWLRVGFCVLVCCAAASVAQADPCEAPLPRVAGVRFEGVVRYVGDGDSLCVGTSRDPANWVEVRLADVDAPELGTREGLPAKRRLERIALGRRAVCTVVRGRTGRTISHDRVIANCTIAGQAISALLHARDPD